MMGANKSQSCIFIKFQSKSESFNKSISTNGYPMDLKFGQQSITIFYNCLPWLNDGFQ